MANSQGRRSKVVIMSQTNCVGRPKGFDVDDVIEKAMAVFWAKGYEGTSLSDLTKAMGINKPSLYATFGNKEQLFLKVVDQYEKRPCGFFHPALGQKDARSVISALLNGAAESLSDNSHPQGCMVIQSALTGSDSAESVKLALINRRLDSQKQLTERFAQAMQDGDLGGQYSAESIACYITTIIQGMAIQATNGATAEQLKQVADITLNNFPGLK